MPRALLMTTVVCLATLSGGAARRPAREAAPTAPPAYVTELAEYDFDDGFGGADPQGWTTIDFTMPADTFTHVDDFAGLDSRFPPNEGTKSLWMGARPSPELCGYAVLPGYGNGWSENFESVSFATTGDVTLTYSIRYDTEIGYDFVDVDYLSKSGSWRQLVSYDGPLLGGYGTGPIVESYIVPAESLDASARFRFQFHSDGGVSDSDGLLGFNSSGAAVLDSIVVTDDGGLVDFQDFEEEAIGSRSTLDGDWSAGVVDYFGDYAGLFDGSTVLQEGTVVNTTHLWGCFNNSSDTYACGGHAEQASIPLMPAVMSGNTPVRLANGAYSPVIDLKLDKDGFPVPGPPDQIAIDYDVYVDLVPDNYVYFNVAVKVFVDNCMNSIWQPRSPANLPGVNKEWRHEQLTVFLPSNATHVQVAVYAYDSGFNSSHTCHSHAPLFDNVSVHGWFDSTSEVGETPVAGYALHANVPNPFNPVTSIVFDVPSPGGEVRVDVFDVSGRWVATLANGRHTGGTHTVEWDGRDAGGVAVASGVYFYRLTAPDVSLSRKMVLLK